MTGPNPIQIVQTKGIGEELLDAMKPFIETLQRNRALEERRLELEQQKEELKLRQNDLKQRQDEYQHGLQRDLETGALLKAMAAIGAAGSGGPPAGTATLTLPSRATAMQPGDDRQAVALRLLADSSLSGTGQPDQGSAGGQAGQASQAGQQQGQQDPERAALGLVANSPAEAVGPALASSKLDMARILRDQASKMEFNRTVDEAADRLDPEMGRQLKLYTALRSASPDAAGIDKIAPQLFPALFPQGVSADQMNAMMHAMEQGRGIVSFGMTRNLLGIGPVKGWPDSFTLPREIKPPSTEQISSMPGYIMMAGAGPKIDQIEDAQRARLANDVAQGRAGVPVGLRFVGQIRRAVQNAASQGGWLLAEGGALVQLIMNGIADPTTPGIPDALRYDPEQTELLNLTLRFATAVKFALSGKQATLNETMAFLELVTPLVTDNARTVRDKREFRHAIQAGIELMVTGQPITKEILDKIIQESQQVPGADVMRDWKAEGDARRAAGIPPEPDQTPEELRALMGRQQVDNVIHQRYVVPRNPLPSGSLFPNPPIPTAPK